MTHSFPTRRSSDLWEGVKRDVGSYVWSALYQQRPAPAKGAIFDMSWWRYWTSDPARANGLDVVYLPNVATPQADDTWVERSEEHTSELQSLMRISYAGFCLKKKKNTPQVRK